ncbi:protein lethal(2)essential for life-like [Maniola jurtina]|uniref:protein lethal(2)essential for life-like n=1 Tax=Maniola jurtina TaxID=191418 RepID=UPI001E686889|nr:protein lethal(2)essential for life-like [Maniola jurtina]
MPFILMSDCPLKRTGTPRHAAHFAGLGLSPSHEDGHYHCGHYNRPNFGPWGIQTVNQAGSSIKQDKDKYQVNLDVQHFAPDDITVKTADGFLVVEAKHEERRDEHGYVARGFTRRYKLPEGIVEDSVMCKLSSDGVLTITASLKAPSAATNERVVPIVQTGPVAQQSAEEKQG